jgi:hypothetical protein
LSGSGEISAEDYQQILERTREAVKATLPADATVMVISRGDEELLELEDRTAWHFPRSQDGKYAGHHPVDSAAALAHLDEWRTRGAQYLVLPATGFWWLEYYSDFAANLRRGHGVAFQDDSCIIFRLGGEAQASAAAQATHKVAPHMTELIDRLLPEKARVAVVSSGDERLVQLGDRMAVHFPPIFLGTDGSDSHDSDQELAALETLREEGVEYLVIPHISPSWLDLHPEFFGAVERRYPCVANRRSICSVFELADLMHLEAETDTDQA